MEIKTTKEILRENTTKTALTFEHTKEQNQILSYFATTLIINSNEDKWVKVEDIKRELIHNLIELKNSRTLNMSEQKGIYLAILNVKLTLQEVEL